MVKQELNELQVASYVLRVASWKFKITSWNLQSTSLNSKVRVQIQASQVQIHGFKNH